MTLTSSTPDALWASGSARALQPAAVVCDDLSRTIRGERLLDRLDLSIDVGARVLIVADRPAAASLLLRILAGLAHPGAGSVRIAGLSRADDSASGWARRIGYVGPLTGIYPWMSPAEALDLTGRLADFDAEERRSRAAAAAVRYELPDPLDAPVRGGGPALAQRTSLACAMLADPEIVLLDQPLLALSPGERLRLLAFPGDRRTVVMTGDESGPERAMADQVLTLRNGRMVASGIVPDA